MASRSFVVIGFSLACLTATAATGRAQQAPPPARAVDPVVEAIRREAEAKRKLNEAEFRRLRAVPVAAAPLLLNGQLIAVPEEDPEIGEQDDGAPPPPKRAIITEETFDALVFSNTGNIEGARNRLDFVLKSRLEHINRILTLSPAQREKLRLAGRGDIRGLFDRIEVKRREFQKIRHDFQQFQTFHPQIQMLSIEIWSGPFGGGSLSAKVLQSIRDEPQSRG